MSRILNITGGDADTMAKAMLRLDKSYTTAGLSGDKTRAVLEATGVSLTDASGKLLPMNQQLEQLSIGFNKALAAGMQEEFLLNTLGSRGLALAQTLKDYSEAKDIASKRTGFGLDPQQMHELDLELKALKMDASQIGLAFTGAFAPIAQELFPPIMSGLQGTANYLTQNKALVVDLTKDVLELAIAYKAVGVASAVSGSIGTLWANAATQVTAAAAAANGLSQVEETAIARTLAASDKMYAKRMADAVKTAQTAGLAAEESATIITEKCVQISAAASAAAVHSTKMTAAFLGTAEAANLAGNAAIIASEKTVGAMANG